MNIPETRLTRYFNLDLPIVQQGMAVNVSDTELVSKILKLDIKILPTLAGAGLTPKELEEKIKTIKETLEENKITDREFLVNLMTGLEDFPKLLNKCIENKVGVVLGAGFRKDAIRKLKEEDIPCFVIASSVRAAKLAVLAGAFGIIIEGPKEAGGHLGIEEKDSNEIQKHLNKSIYNLIEEIVIFLREKQNFKGSIIAAGGILTGKEIKKALDLGVDGVGLGMRFAMSDESGFSGDVKEILVKTKSTKIIISPVGLPGRVAEDQEIDNLPKVKDEKKCRECLSHCGKQYCIFKALQNSTKEKNKDRIIPRNKKLIFASECVTRIDNILPVKTIVQQLKEEILNA